MKDPQGSGATFQIFFTELAVQKFLWGERTKKPKIRITLALGPKTKPAD